MKKYLLILVIPFLFACNTHKKEMEHMKVSSDSMKAIIEQRDKTVNDFLSSFNEIQDNLNTIKEKEKLISVNTAKKGELKKDAKEQINDDIKSIYDLLIKNKKIINSLSKKLKNSNLKIAELQKTIENLTKLVEEKDASINTLKEQLAKLNIDVAHLSANVDSLKTDTKSKQKVIEQKTSELNTAYYLIGTKKQLRDKKITDKEGGFIGLGKATKVASTFDKSIFTKIDITQVKSIAINSKKAKLLTNHPANSYKLEGKDRIESITILDPKEFWSVSKYLVISVD